MICVIVVLLAYHHHHVNFNYKRRRDASHFSLNVMTITIYPLYTQLSKDYISFYENGSKYADVTIRVGKNENVEEFNVHSFVLLSRSDYFCKKIEEIKEK